MRRTLGNQPDPEKTEVLNPPTVNQSDISQVDDHGKLIEGLGDTIKESVKEEQKNIRKFEGLSSVASRNLFSFKTIFPFIIFPTEVVIDLTKVTIIDHIFFFSKTVHSVFIADITDVLAHNSLIYASLEIVDAGFTQNSIIVKHLNKHDATKAGEIIQGLVITKKQDVDLSKLESLSNEEIIEKLTLLGKAQ